jgi:hypothetical protein
MSGGILRDPEAEKQGWVLIIRPVAPASWIAYLPKCPTCNVGVVRIIIQDLYLLRGSLPKQTATLILLHSSVP